MAGKVIIDRERCKGCGLCVEVCPKGILRTAQQTNKNGYFPAERAEDAMGCVGCALCALICPDVAIEVMQEDEQVPEQSGKSKPALARERT